MKGVPLLGLEVNLCALIVGLETHALLHAAAMAAAGGVPLLVAMVIALLSSVIGLVLLTLAGLGVYVYIRRRAVCELWSLPDLERYHIIVFFWFFLFSCMFSHALHTSSVCPCSKCCHTYTCTPHHTTYHPTCTPHHHTCAHAYPSGKKASFKRDSHR